MDIDRFVRDHSAEWARLDQLARRRRLDAAEADELVMVYQRCATHLSVVQSSYPDPVVVGRLSQTLALARSAVLSAAPGGWREVARFVRYSFPVAAYRARWWWLSAALGSTAVSVLVAVWIARDPQVLAAVASPEDVQRIVDTDFAAYYRENPAGSFAAQVWTNNAWIAAQTLVGGAFGCVFALWVLFQNALNLGVVGGIMASAGRLDLFFGLITPHGLLELSAVFLAAGVGLRLGWQLFVPGPRPRAVAFAVEGRAAITVAIGLVPVLLVSGIVEAFVTPSALPTFARIAIGVTVWSAFLTYVLVLGRRADRAGLTGDLVAEGSTTDLLPYAV